MSIFLITQTEYYLQLLRLITITGASLVLLTILVCLAVFYFQYGRYLK